MPFETQSRYLQQFEPKLSQLGNDRDLWWVVPFSLRYVVGVAGRRFAGTSTALTHLGDKLGFKVYSLSGELREIARRQGVPLDSRERLQDLGDELRAQRQDGGYLARLTLQRIRADQLHRPESRARIAVGGFKHPDEIAVFEKLDSFHFLQLHVGEKRRYDRAVKSGMLDLEHGVARQGLIWFKREVDARDRDGRGFHDWTGDCGQWVDGVLQQPAKIIRNGFSRGKLFESLGDWVEELDREHQKPELEA
jgi:hypothetical protein